MAEGGHSLNLSCSVCFEDIGFKDFGKPKVLPCGHTFCCQCVKRMVGRNSSFTCPTCRKNICLPESGKVEDFATNFALLDLIPDIKRIQRDNANHSNVDSGCDCQKHKNRTKFYCKSCKKPVCAECLLQDHKLDTHSTATTSDMATIFSRELQEHLQQPKVYKKKKKSLGDNISKGLQFYEENKKTLQDGVKNAVQRKQEMLKKSEENLMNRLSKKAERHPKTYREKHSYPRESSRKNQEKSNDSHHPLRNCDLSHASNLEEISKDLKNLKAGTDSLETIHQSTPTEEGVNFKPKEVNYQVGKLQSKLNTSPTMPMTNNTAEDDLLIMSDQQDQQEGAYHRHQKNFHLEYTKYESEDDSSSEDASPRMDRYVSEDDLLCGYIMMSNYMTL